MSEEEKAVLLRLRSANLNLEDIKHKLDFVEAQRNILLILHLEEDEEYQFLKRAGDLIRMGDKTEVPQDSMAAW
jgi:hypothetical protein